MNSLDSTITPMEAWKAFSQERPTARATASMIMRIPRSVLSKVSGSWTSCSAAAPRSSVNKLSCTEPSEASRPCPWIPVSTASGGGVSGSAPEFESRRLPSLAEPRRSPSLACCAAPGSGLVAFALSPPSSRTRSAIWSSTRIARIEDKVKMAAATISTSSWEAFGNWSVENQRKKVRAIQLIVRFSVICATWMRRMILCVGGQCFSVHLCSSFRLNNVATKMKTSKATPATVSSASASKVT
mmetsp:Transcript_89841/g.259079  ORF Transcript_89841/g.259079 Transcript_89841/m.259079 type:complete len:242 (-) Transcript_89841:1130-1855(-)